MDGRTPNAVERVEPYRKHFETLEEISFPAGRDRADCEEAIHAAQDCLRDYGPASMRELVVGVMPEYPVGYEVPRS